MAIYPYQLADGSTRWFYILDLPTSADGQRRQRKKRGFLSQRWVRPTLGDLRYQECYDKITEVLRYYLLTRCRDGGI
jgi:hypothetical protein